MTVAMTIYCFVVPAVFRRLVSLRLFRLAVFWTYLSGLRWVLVEVLEWEAMRDGKRDLP